ncbi:MAG: serine hydroxymethyltransferase [Acholeplasmataceae bacterium]|jgi:glycine hydroxymethyltransferase
MSDQPIFNIINEEYQRQTKHIELIASENYTSEDVMKAQGSILTNKYAEGYPGDRYYGGCEVVDKIEDLAIQRLKSLFNAKYANVQPHSGSQANAAVFQALLKPGDKILSLSLNEGGHLTHGYPLNFSGKVYQSFHYSLDPKTEMLDYDEILNIAKIVRPKLIITGYSSYSRFIDFEKFRSIADEVGAYLHADIAHISGLVAANLHPSPLPYAHVVTSTTHKTLRGPRGGIIMTNDDMVAKKVDKSVFPGMQGGPLMHVIAGKAIAFLEASKPEFKAYQQQVLNNAKALAQAFKKLGYRVISGDTDNHLLVIDVYEKYQITGLEAQKTLDSIYITTNKNNIPFDTQKPKYGSGLRLGTPAVTTRGMIEEDMNRIAAWIDDALKNFQDPATLSRLRNEIETFTKGFPLVK